MSFKISIASLRETLQAEREVIHSALDEMKKEKVDEEALTALLEKLESDIDGFVTQVETEFGLGLKDYDMVKYLNKMLEIEYQGIFDYNYYASLVTDEELAEDLREFGTMEIEHSQLLTSKIKKLGAKAIFPSAVKRNKFKNPLQMLKHHAESEREAIKLCEEGAKIFTDPDLQWILGTIRVDELEHQKKISNLIKKFENIEMIFNIQTKYNPPKEVDFDSDEPWTEG